MPNGNLVVPESATDPAGRVTGDAYVEISPKDPEYPRLVRQAVSEEEFHRRRQRWREGDEALRREFERYLAEVRESGGADGGATPRPD